MPLAAGDTLQLAWRSANLHAAAGADGGAEEDGQAWRPLAVKQVLGGIIENTQRSTLFR